MIRSSFIIGEDGYRKLFEIMEKISLLCKNSLKQFSWKIWMEYEQWEEKKFFLAYNNAIRSEWLNVKIGREVRKSVNF